LAFGRLLPRIRRRVAKDLAMPTLSRNKILATVVRLLETTLIRVGNEEYARTNDSFGLTTMRDRHVKVNGSTMRFEFRGKSGIVHAVDVTDRRLARIVKQSRDLPGYELFQYIDEQGQRRSIDSSDVNAYLQQIAGEEFTAKDFRTWAGTVLAAGALQEFQPYKSAAQAKRNVVAAIEAVAKRLGNTKAICRKCYIHPDIINSYMEGSLAELLRQHMSPDPAHACRDLPRVEAAVLACLQARLRVGSRRPHHSKAG
jgi:DNA topoisomerase I